MARDRQWVVLDQSQTEKKDREPSAKETLERDGEAETGKPDRETPEGFDSYAPGE